MAGNPQVFGLLEEMLDSGKTPEEVCRECPELLAEVRRRWRVFRLIDAQVGALLPEPGTPLSTLLTPVGPHAAGLPQDEREVFDLIRIQGLTRAEAAGVVGASEKTVQRRLNRARLLLAERLANLRSATSDDPTPPGAIHPA